MKKQDCKHTSKILTLCHSQNLCYLPHHPKTNTPQFNTQSNKNFWVRQNNLPDVKYKAFNTHSLTQQHIAVTPTTSHTMKNHFMFSYYIQVNIQFFSIAFKNFQNLKLPFNLMTHYLQFLNYVMLFLFSLLLHLLFILWEKRSKIHYLCNSPQVVCHFLNTKHLKENHYYFKNSYYFIIGLFIYFPQLCSFLESKILNRGLLVEANITLTPKNGCEPSSKPRDGIPAIIRQTTLEFPIIRFYL